MPQKIRILLLDDSAADAELLERSLARTRSDFTLKRVDSRADLVLEITQAPPDLILVDSRMPTLDAIQVLNLVREQQVEIPVIVVTGTLNDEVAALCLEHGAVDYVLKDRLVRLPSAIGRALDEKKLRSERIQAATALAESEERFRQIAETIDEVFWLVEVETGQLIYVSPAYEKIWGQPSDTAYAKRFSWLEAVHPEDRRNVKQASQKMDSEPYDIEYRIIRPDGTVRWIHDRAFLIRDSKGRVYRIAGIAEDITQRRQLEQQFRHAQKMEAVGQLAGGIAHDFNNLLTIITGYAQLGMSGLPNNDPRGYNLDQIRKAAQRAASLTRQLVAFSRTQILQPRVLDLNQVVSNVEGMLGRLIGEDIQLKTVHEPELGLVKADPGQIEQVIFNLVVNARDAMSRGGIITIETANALLDADHSREEDTQLSPGWHVMLAVGDTGCGMDQETLSRIFEPFFTTKEPGKGTGLGLSTVYGIIKQSGGSIRVDSEPGHGTTFKIYLPRVPGPVSEIKPPGTVASLHGSETILLSEDDDIVRELMCEILSRSGYTILKASDGYDALRIARRAESPIHLLLTDVVMPNLSGQELAEQIVTYLPDIKILYMSGYPDKLIQRQGGLDPGTNFIAKPFTSEKLLEKIRQLLDA